MSKIVTSEPIFTNLVLAYLSKLLRSPPIKLAQYFSFGLSEREDRTAYTSSPSKDKSGVIVIITLLVIPLAVVLFTLNKRKRRVK